RLIANQQVASAVVDRMDRELVSRRAAGDSAHTHPFSSKLAVAYQPQYGMPVGAFVRTEDIPAVTAMIDQARAGGFYPPEVDLFWESEERTIGGNKGKVLHFVNKTVEMSGDMVASAERRFDLDYERPNSPGVSMNFSTRGATRFAQVTKANVGNHLAIVLDNVVRSARVIREGIGGGGASIPGG